MNDLIYVVTAVSYITEFKCETFWHFKFHAG